MLRSFLATMLYRMTAIPIEFPRDLSAKWLELTALSRSFLKEQRVNVIIDVGANEGQFAAKLRCLGFTGSIVSFEPDPRCYSRLVLRHGDDPAWRSYPVAPGDADTDATFNLTKKSVFNSFLSPINPAQVSRTVPVPVAGLTA